MTQSTSYILQGAGAERLESRLAQPPYERLWQRLQSRTREVTRHALATDFAGTVGSLGWHSCTPMLPEAALLVRLTGDTTWMTYLETALQTLDAQSRERLASGTPRCIHSHMELAVAADLLRDRLPAAFRERLLAFMREVAIDDHSGTSYRAYGGGSNVSWCHNTQAAVCALLWGDASGHPRWRAIVQQGIDHTRCYLRYGADAGGYSYEGTGYGQAVFAYMFPFVELLATTRTLDLYALEPSLRRVADAIAATIFPDRSFPVNDNDVGLRGAETLPWLLILARRFDDPALRGLWEAYQGPDHPIRPYGDFRPWVHARTDAPAPAPDPHNAMLTALLYWDADAPVTPLDDQPRPLAVYSRGTETTNLRTSWGTDAIQVNVQGAGRSHASQTHRHADAGHFSIFAHGEYLAIDTGRYNSDEDQHSVMIVDGRCHRPLAPGWGEDTFAGRVSHFTSRQLLTHLRIDAAHQKGCCWAERDLLWVPLGGDDAYLVVIDNVNKDNAAHAFWWQLQVHPAAELRLRNDWQASVQGQRARLDISFTWPGPADFPDQPHRFTLRHDTKEWHWPYGHDRDIEAAHQQEGLLNTSFRRPRLIGQLNGLNGHLMSVIVPRRHEAPALPVRRRTEQHLLITEIDTPLGTDTVIAAPDSGFIETGSLRCLSPLLFLRHDADSNLLASWTLNDAPLEAIT